MSSLGSRTSVGFTETTRADHEAPSPRSSPMAATRHPETPTSTLPTTLVEEDLVTSSTGRRVLAAARLATRFIFLWAFLDKTFGLHYSTGAAVAEGEPSLAWINGGTPSQGFLTYAAQGPFKEFFNSISGVATDWLFMLGMLGVGLAVMLGIGLRVAAVSGALIMAMMWLPPGRP